MKESRRQVQSGGYLQFENLPYKGENLGGYAGESIAIRFDPKNITTILIYRREGDKDVFLTRAHAQGLETEEISQDEAKAMRRKIREKGKAVTSKTILAEVRDRDIFVSKKPTHKERKKAEQAFKVKAKQESQPQIENEETELESTDAQENWEMPELIDYEQMRNDYGF